ncbi:hypothetical protein C7I84_05020 [Mesorhizobium ephedrae]|uniref:Flagellar biosynthesis protein FliO n=1 Tax=Kumtagia ephedrae TaxID=2116701 RepID=A0A2P7SQ08_9HYPH|nr:hypothetical protein C7I84_05020 [Mesorhizobium ephedrae]
MDWLDEVAGPGYSQAVLWTLFALLLLVVLLIVVKVFRGMFFGTFVAGGRNRKTRLAVMDATAVDSHRRLVLVRRDDIEHLLLIGGPTDVVVERDIRIGQQRRPSLPPEGAREPQAPAPAAQPAPAPAAAPPQRAPEPLRAAPPPPPAKPVPEVPAPVLRRPAESAAPLPRLPEPPPPQPSERLAPPRPAAQPVAPPRPEPRPAPAGPEPRPAPAGPVLPAASALRNPPPPSPSDDLDDALLKELEVSLDDDETKGGKPGPAPSLDDEMARLLGELSKPRR